MASGTRKTGDWGKVSRIIGGLGADMEYAQQKSLKRFALKAEAIAKGHISKQDLNWPALKPATQEKKARAGQSSKILVATSSYFQAITSYVEGETAYAGVKKTSKNEEGEVIADIARVLEFGSVSRNIEERPLWRPTFKGAMGWHVKNNSPTKYFMERMKTKV